mmetsp:Transcript_73136/g.191726  ORF Transcript_73136/g.191726 Transcript_73136/m.191726 type:complete len:170 (-) Transcript_73136:22-531(-)
MGHGGSSICCTQLQAHGSYGRDVDFVGSELVLAGKLGDFNLPAAANGGEPKGSEFKVLIDRRSGGKLGLDVDQLSGSVLIVDAIKDGLIQNWNDEHPARALRVGDYIVSVNGVRGDGLQLVEECKKMQIISLVCRRRPGGNDDDAPGMCRTKQCATFCRVPCTDAPTAS